MRTTALNQCGETLWIVGDQVFNPYVATNNEGSLRLLDAITG
jgi:hypothetical protein